MKKLQKYYWISRIEVSKKISLDKLSRIAILKTFARQTFAKKAKIREIRESFSRESFSD